MADDTLSDLSLSDISKLKVPDLKRELKLRGLSSSGNKNELVERLQTSVKSSDGVSADSVDDLDEDLLNDDDDEHLEADIVVEDDENALEESISSKNLKRKLSDESDHKQDTEEPPKKVILNRNISHISLETKPPLEKDEVNGSSMDEKKVVKLSELSAKERLEMRAKKFGVAVTGDIKKAVRAERFGGNPIQSSGNGINTNVNTSIDVLKQRAERFGGSVSTMMSKVENQERLEKRKARFGVVTNTSNGLLSTTDKAKQRLERFKQPVK